MQTIFQFCKGRRAVVPRRNCNPRNSGVRALSLRSVGRAVEKTSLAERAVTSQEPENQVTTVPCASAGAGAETQSEPPGSPQELPDAARALVALLYRPARRTGFLSVMDPNLPEVFRKRTLGDVY